MRIGIALAAVVGSVVIVVPAFANGRFPEAQTIESVPGDPSVLFLRTTFGILVSRDAGKRWRWICERAFGYEGQWDPPITATRDGRLWVGLEDGLKATRTDGCGVETFHELDGYTVKDLTVDARGDTLFAITGAPGKPSHVWRRRPDKPFERLAAFEDVNVMTIEVAPSTSQRVYVSGQSYATIRGQIFRSDDGGMTFRTDIGDGGAASSGLEANGPFFIGAVDRVDPSRLLVRHLHANGSDLLLTRDGGRTFQNVLSMKSAMYGFAKSGDGKTFWAGSGLPEHGIFRSTDRGEHFVPAGNNGVLCLSSVGPGALFVCQNAFTLGAPAIGVSRDEGATVESLARFRDIEGPVTCTEPDASASLCAGTWPSIQELFEDAGAPAPAPGDAGIRKRRARDAGPAEPAREGQGKRCSCEAPGLGRAPALSELGWLVALAVWVRRRITGGSEMTRS